MDHCLAAAPLCHAPGIENPLARRKKSGFQYVLVLASCDVLGLLPLLVGVLGLLLAGARHQVARRDAILGDARVKIDTLWMVHRGRPPVGAFVDPSCGEDLGSRVGEVKLLPVCEHDAGP